MQVQVQLAQQPQQHMPNVTLRGSWPGMALPGFQAPPGVRSLQQQAAVNSAHVNGLLPGSNINAGHRPTSPPVFQK